MMSLDIKNTIPIGKNSQYLFGIGQIKDRWVGFAEGGGALFMFPQISQGHVLGLTDRDKMIRLTGAIAQDVGSGYGGIETWYVPLYLQGNPEHYRCKDCQEVGCEGSCQGEEWSGEELPFAELRQSIAPPMFGSKGPCERCPCCQATWTECAECEGDREIGIEGAPDEDGLYTCPCPSCEGEGGYWVCERDCDAVGKHLVH